MRQRRSTHPAPRPKLLDSIYLLVSALVIVGVLIAYSALQINSSSSPWMPHNDRAEQIMFSVMGFIWGALFLFTARQSRTVERMFGGQPQMHSLKKLIAPIWLSAAMSVIGFGAGIYFLLLFVTHSQEI